MATAALRNGRDSESQLSFILNIGNGVDRYTNDFTGGEIVQVPFGPSDRYAVFFPTPGVNFYVGPSEAGLTPTPNITPTGGIVSSYEGVLNPAAINLLESQFTELWVKSDNPQVLTILIYRGNR